MVVFPESLPGLVQLLILLGQSPVKLLAFQKLPLSSTFELHSRLLSNTYEDQNNRQRHAKNREATDHPRQVHNLADFIPS